MLFVLLVYHSHICEIHNMDFRTVCLTWKLIMEYEMYGECEISDGVLKQIKKHLNYFWDHFIGFTYELAIIGPSGMSGYFSLH